MIPSCLGASGSVRARQIPQSALRAIEVHTFWPFRTKPPSTRVARVDRAARSLPAPGSLKSWHQPIRPSRVGPTKRSCCSSVPWAMIVGRAHAPTAMDGRGDPGGGQLLVDHQLLDRTGAAPVGDGPVRGQQPGLDEQPAPLGVVGGGGHLGHHGADLAPERPRRRPAARWRAPARLPARAAREASARSAAEPPEELPQRQGPAQVEVGVVLPGEAHPPEDLDAALGRLHVGVEGHGPGQHGRQCRPGRRRRRRRPGPRPRPGPSTCSTETSMSASRCLTAWNCPMGRPNWRRSLAYSVAVSRHHRAPPAHSAAAMARARSRTSGVVDTAEARARGRRRRRRLPRRPPAGSGPGWPAARR